MAPRNEIIMTNMEEKNENNTEDIIAEELPERIKGWIEKDFPKLPDYEVFVSKNDYDFVNKEVRAQHPRSGYTLVNVNYAAFLIAEEENLHKLKYDMDRICQTKCKHYVSKKYVMAGGDDGEKKIIPGHCGIRGSQHYELCHINNATQMINMIMTDIKQNGYHDPEEVKEWFPEYEKLMDELATLQQLVDDDNESVDLLTNKLLYHYIVKPQLQTSLLDMQKKDAKNAARREKRKALKAAAQTNEIPLSLTKQKQSARKKNDAVAEKQTVDVEETTIIGTLKNTATSFLNLFKNPKLK